MTRVKTGEGRVWDDMLYASQKEKKIKIKEKKLNVADQVKKNDCNRSSTNNESRCVEETEEGDEEETTEK